MGQGTESCQGYEVDYDEYEEGLSSGVWIQRGGGEIHVSKMSLHHLLNCRRIVQQRAAIANFTSDTEMWNEWEELLNREIESRPEPVRKPYKAPQPVRGTKVAMICHCGQEYNARQADIKRKQGLSCSKRCAAIRREFGRPPAQRKP